MKRIALLALLIFAANATAADDVESGPKADAKIAALKAHFITGTHEGKEVDIAAERKEEPTVYFFVNTAKFDRPVFRLMKEFDNKIAETNAKVSSYAVWVNMKDDKEKERLPKIGQSAKFGKIDIGWIESGTPEGWGLNDDAHLTVVVAKKGKVAKTFAWKSVNETEVKKVLEAVK